jgi:polysaccharide pyruvyl transferase WcaK-like protein
LTAALRVTLSSIFLLTKSTDENFTSRSVTQLMTSKKLKKIGVLGHVGNGNLGDEATFSAVIQRVQRRYPESKICGFSLNPIDTQGRHKIPAFPLRRLNNNAGTLNQKNPQKREKHSFFKEQITNQLKAIALIYRFLKAVKQGVVIFSHLYREAFFLLRSFGRLKGCELLVVAGAGQLADDFGGPWGYPYTLLKWCILAKIARVKIIFLSLGVGPLTSILGRLFIKWALSLGVYRSYRDYNSQRQIREIGVAGENPIFPDLAYSLEILPPLGRSGKLGPPVIVGINVMPLYAGYLQENEKDTYENYVRYLASFTSWLLQDGYSVMFFPTQLRLDQLAILDVRAAISANERQSPLLLKDPLIVSFDDLIREVGKVDIIVATRFHAILFSYLLNKPVLGISYNEKIDHLMAAVQQSDYTVGACRCSVNLLVDKFNLLRSRCKNVSEQLEVSVGEQRAALEQQYENVFP